MIFGIDPGTTGAAFAIWSTFDLPTRCCRLLRFKNTSRQEQIDWFSEGLLLAVYLENVHGMPGDTPVTAFSFGRAHGKMEERFEEARGCDLMKFASLVDSKTWQREFSLVGMKREDKMRRQVVIAQELFPEIKVTQDAAAAILIAEYGWRKHYGVLVNEKRIKDFDGSQRRGAGVISESAKRKR